MKLVTIINRLGNVVFEKENDNKVLLTDAYCFVIQLNSQSITTDKNLLKEKINY